MIFSYNQIAQSFLEIDFFWICIKSLTSGSVIMEVMEWYGLDVNWSHYLKLT